MSNPRRVSSELPSRAPSELPSPANEMPTTPDFAMSGLQSHINTPNEFPGIPDELDWSALDEAISGLEPAALDRLGPQSPASSPPPWAEASSSLLPASSLSFAPTIAYTAKGRATARFLSQWLQHLEADLPKGFKRMAPAKLPLIMSPYHNDVPFLAMPSLEKQRNVGKGLWAVFGEVVGKQKGVDKDVRRQVLAICCFNGDLLLARIKLSIEREELQSEWRKRIAISVRPSSIQSIFPDLPSEARQGDDAAQRLKIADWIIEQGEKFDAEALIATLEKDGAQPDHFSYLRSKFRPGLPDLHLARQPSETTTNRLRHNDTSIEFGKAAIVAEAHLAALRQRILRQPTARLALFLLLGTYVDKVMLAVLAAITRGDDSESPIHAATTGLDAFQLASILLRWGMRPDLPLKMPKSRLLSSAEWKLGARTRAEHNIAQNIRRTLTPWRMLSKHEFIRRVAQDCVRRLRGEKKRWDEKHKDDKKPYPYHIPTIPEMHDILVKRFEEQPRCQLCNVLLTYWRRRKGGKTPAEPGASAEDVEKEAQEAEAASKELEQEFQAVASQEAGGDGSDDAVAPEDVEELERLGDDTTVGPTTQHSLTVDELGFQYGVNFLQQEERWDKQTSNASPDRIVPGSGYDLKSIQSLCIGCQILKYTHSMDEARLMVHHQACGWHAEDAPRRSAPVGDVLAVEVDDQPDDPDQVEKDALDRFAASKMSHIDYRKKLLVDKELESHPVVTDSNLEEEQARQLILRRRVDRGRGMSADGVVWSMKFLSIDRINPKEGYKAENVRLILHGHNSIRADSMTDAAWTAYNDAMDLKFIKQQVALVDKRIKLPYADWPDEDGRASPKLAIFDDEDEEDEEDEEGEEGDEGDEGDEDEEPSVEEW